MRAVGLIPARGGSKGIPGKNLAPLLGRPLLAYTCQTALGSHRLERTLVSTDDPAIAEAARQHGVEAPFLRPAALAADETPILDVLLHALDWLRDHGGGEPDALVLLQPTSPLRRAEHVDDAVARLEASGADAVVSVVEVPHAFNPVSVLRLDEDRLVPYLPGPPILRRQDKPRVYARNGPAVLASRARTLRGGSLYGADCRPLPMDPEDSVDVDTPFDLALVAWLLERRAFAAASTP